MSCQGIGGVYTAVLTTGTTEVDLQAFKITPQVIVYGHIHDVECAVEKIGHFGLLFEEVLYRLVAAGEFFILIKPAGVEQPAAVEYKPAAIGGIAGGYTIAVREAVYFNYQWRGIGSTQGFKAADDIIGDTKPEAFVEFGYRDAHAAIVGKPFHVAQGQGNAGKELRLALEEPPETISAQHLQQADEHIAVVLRGEDDFIHRVLENKVGLIDVIIQQALLPVVGQFGPGLPEQGSHIVLQGAAHAALVIDEMYFIVFHHNVPALEIAEHKVFVLGMRKVSAQRFKIVQQGLFVVGVFERVEESSI